jgi:hypothetical protein
MDRGYTRFYCSDRHTCFYTDAFRIPRVAESLESEAQPNAVGDDAGVFELLDMFL